MYKIILVHLQYSFKKQWLIKRKIIFITFSVNDSPSLFVWCVPRFNVKWPKSIQIAAQPLNKNNE